MTVAETGWTMWMVSHFHYDPVWWNTQAGFTETLKVMGHVDNCVANSGVSGRGKGSLLEMDYEEWRRVMRVNLDGVFFTFQAAARPRVAAARVRPPLREPRLRHRSLL